MGPGFNLLFLFIFSGVLFVVFGIPLKQGRVPPNRFYGFRTPRTLTNETVWYAVNRVTGADMVASGIAIIAVSLVMMALRGFITPDAAIMVVLATMIASALYMAIHGFMALRKL